MTQAGLYAVKPSETVTTLPDTRMAWPEINTGAGFSNSERVELAAAWFDHRSESNVWHTNDRALIRTQTRNGQRWVDPSTGEVLDVERPLSEIVAHSTTTGRPLVFAEGNWIDSETKRSVDPANVTVSLADEKRSAPLDYTFSITPGTVRLQVTDPRTTTPDPVVVPGDTDSDAMSVDEFYQVTDPLLNEAESSDVPRWKKILTDQIPADAATAGRRSGVREFSRKSRSNLIYRVLATPWADYLQPGERLWFVTLTAPADWKKWLGTHDLSERAMKRFADRVADHTDAPARFFWKREFQRRGAPHWHLVLIAPMRVKDQPLRQFISQQWYAAVASGEQKHLLAGTNVDIGSSVKAVDPKRLALYFAGYSTSKDKDYQHVLPYGYEAPDTGATGRWWGAKGLPKKEATVRITHGDMIEIQRLLRARQRSQRGELEPGRTQIRQPLTKQTVVRRWTFRKLGGNARTFEGPPAPVWRKVRRRTRLRSLKGTTHGCTIYVNDGPALATAIARTLQQRHTMGTARR